MRWLFFLSRVAFICNVFFVVAVSLQLARWFKNEEAESLVIILGYFMAIVCNSAANLCYLYLLLPKKPELQTIPVWLRLANFLFLLLQLYFILHLHGQ